jgi:hypothetical protein
MTKDIVSQGRMVCARLAMLYVQTRPASNRRTLVQKFLLRSKLDAVWILNFTKFQGWQDKTEFSSQGKLDFGGDFFPARACFRASGDDAFSLIFPADLNWDFDFDNAIDSGSKDVNCNLERCGTYSSTTRRSTKN